MIRNIAPAELGSTASAMYLCARNLVGGIGPLAVAKLAGPVGLQHAMLLAPACYVVSGVLFWVGEGLLERHAREAAAQKAMQQLVAGAESAAAAAAAAAAEGAGEEAAAGAGAGADAATVVGAGGGAAAGQAQA
jgi:hypothetical protein